MSRLCRLNSDGAAYRLSALLECLYGKDVTNEELDAIHALKRDCVVVAGRRISSFAYAILDVLGKEMYIGDDVDTKQLIKELKANTKGGGVK